MNEPHLFLDFVARLLGTDEGWAWLTAQPAFHQGFLLGCLVASLVGLVLALVLFRVGSYLGFRQFKAAIATALRAFREETIERERTYQSLLKLKDAESGAQLERLNAELAEATRARRTYEELSARTSAILRRKRWLFLAPRQDDLLLDELRQERDRYLQASHRLANSLRRIMVDLPAALRNEAQEVLTRLPELADAADDDADDDAPAGPAR